MNLVEIKKLEESLTRGEYDQVAKTLDQVLAEDLPETTAAEIRTKLITLYLRAVNGINRRYLAELEQLVTRYKTEV